MNRMRYLSICLVQVMQLTMLCFGSRSNLKSKYVESCYCLKASLTMMNKNPLKNSVDNPLCCFM